MWATAGASSGCCRCGARSAQSKAIAAALPRAVWRHLAARACFPMLSSQSDGARDAGCPGKLALLCLTRAARLHQLQLAHNVGIAHLVHLVQPHLRNGDEGRVTTALGCSPRLGTPTWLRSKAQSGHRLALRIQCVNAASNAASGTQSRRCRPWNCPYHGSVSNDGGGVSVNARSGAGHRLAVRGGGSCSHASRQLLLLPPDRHSPGDGTWCLGPCNKPQGGAGESSQT